MGKTDTVVACASREECIKAFQAGLVPWFTRDRVVPEWIEDAAAMDSCSHAPITSNPDAFVVSLGTDELARHGAAWLAYRTGRQLIQIETDIDVIPERCTRALSICIVGPSLEGQQGVQEARWLSTVIDVFRLWSSRREAQGEPCPCWGFLTASDDGALANLLTKSALSGPLAKAAARRQTCLVEDTGAPWEPHDPAHQPWWGSIGNVANVDILNSRGWKDKAPFERNPEGFDWFMLEGHGRTYCLGGGMACAGRHHTQSPETPVTTCMGDFDCVSDQHARLDPRRYNARVVVLDGCESLNPSGIAWSLGHESVSFRAILGPASAAIGTDILIMRGQSSLIDLYINALASKTLGETVRRFNSLRRRANPAMPFLLLGDPETPCFAQKPDWAERLESPLYKIDSLETLKELVAPLALTVVDEVSNLYPTDLPAASLVDTTAVPPEPQPSEPAKTAPPGLRRDLVPVWQKFQERFAQRNTSSSPANLLQTVMDASADLVWEISARSAATSWPEDLWPVRIQSAELGDVCGVCGRDALGRAYKTGNAYRKWIECRHCRVTLDHPTGVNNPRLSLELSPSSSDLLPEVSLSIQATDTPLAGAAVFFIDGIGHERLIQQQLHKFVCLPNELTTRSTKLLALGPPKVAQLYSLRCLAVLNGQLWWLSVPLLAKRHSVVDGQ